MKILFVTCCLTTAIAILSVFSSRHAPLQRRVLPWIGGMVLGIGAFWILPEMAEQRGWVVSLIGVSAILFALAMIDRFIYPICPYCAAGAHPDATIGSVRSCRRTITLGWPLLVFGCTHSFLDGWTIAFSQVAPLSDASTALSWGAIVHKLPESVAIGILAARLTSSRTLALGAVVLIQTTMAVGGTLAVFAGNLDARWADIYSMPACAVLLLFGLLALQEERQFRGSAAAIRAAAPGLVGCGLAALVGQIVSR
jgi:zinc transporter ZupT